MTSLRRNSTFVRVLLALLCLTCSVEAGGRLHHGPVCNGLDAPCAPRRPTYGYTPTTWRRWPGIQTSAPQPTRAPEELPVPPSESRPSVEPELPPVAAEEAPLVPTETEPPLPPQSTEPVAPPFEDSPPAPPAEGEPKQGPESLPAEPTPTTTAPADNLFDPPATGPATEPAPDSEESPPAMPADDPFKDDPFKDDPTPAGPTVEPAKGGANEQRGAPALLGAHAGGAAPWTRTARDSRGPELKPYGQESEPRRLSHSARPPETQAAWPTHTAARRNPLRSASPKVSPRGIVPTSGWTEDRPATQVSSAGRANPLRAR